MKKDLIIEMEEECVECPKLSLETVFIGMDNWDALKYHQCEHLDFCKVVRQNWEKVKGKKWKSQ